MRHECADHTCMYNADYRWCEYPTLWNKPLEEGDYDGCTGTHRNRDKFARALRKKRGEVLRTHSHLSGFGYVGKLGLLYECIRHGKAFLEYGYGDEEDE